MRRAHEGALLRCYHATLVAGGVEGYPWEACLTDYRWAMLQCLFGYAWCVHCPALPRPYYLLLPSRQIDLSLIHI